MDFKGIFVKLKNFTFALGQLDWLTATFFPRKLSNLFYSFIQYALYKINKTIIFLFTCRERQHWQQCSRRYSGHQHHHDRTMTTTASSSRKSASKTPDTTLASSSKHSSKRDSSEMMYTASPHKKSSLKTSAHQPLLLNPNGLPTNHTQSHYDESSRVYHITP